MVDPTYVSNEIIGDSASFLVSVKKLKKKNKKKMIGSFVHCHAHWLHNCRIFLMIALTVLAASPPSPLPSACPCHKQTSKREDQ